MTRRRPGPTMVAGDPMIGQVVFGYRITREVGRGGMGVVYEAISTTFGGRAALKCLAADLTENTDAVGRFIDEARAANAVHHPGLVKIFNCDRLPDGTPYILMEFLDGESLRDRHEQLLQQGALLNLPEALRIARQVACAVDAVHRKGIVHRDLKPGNVILVPGPLDGDPEQVRIVDFGIAKMTLAQDGEAAAARKTTEGKFLGTAIYASPEQCLMEGNVGTYSDVYSLGIMIYEILTGNPPFTGGTGAVIAQHVIKPPPPLRLAAPTVPEPVHELVHRMLVKEPQDRPSMAEVAAQLDHIQLDGARWVWWLRRRRMSLATGAGTLLLLGGAGFYLAMRPSHQATLAVPTATAPTPARSLPAQPPSHAEAVATVAPPTAAAQTRAAAISAPQGKRPGHPTKTSHDRAAPIQALTKSPEVKPPLVETTPPAVKSVEPTPNPPPLQEKPIARKKYDAIY